MQPKITAGIQNQLTRKLRVPLYVQTKNKLFASWPEAKMAAALPSFSDKTSARSGDKHKPRRGTEEEATQITTATIQGFGGAAGSHGHCLALVSYFVLLLKLFLGCGWHFSEQRLGEKKHFKCFCKVFCLFCFCVYSKTLFFPFIFSKGEEGSGGTEREGVSERVRKDERVEEKHSKDIVKWKKEMSEGRRGLTHRNFVSRSSDVVAWPRCDTMTQDSHSCVCARIKQDQTHDVSGGRAKYMACRWQVSVKCEAYFNK